MPGKVVKKVHCGICSSECPVDAFVEDGRIVSIEGKLCSKGAASRQYVYNKERILYPMRQTGEKGSGSFGVEKYIWEPALFSGSGPYKYTADLEQ